jgi:hypothetical protein
MSMSARSSLRTIRRFAADAMVGLALFVFLVSVTAPDRSSAAPQLRDLMALSAQAGEGTGELTRDPATMVASVASVAVPQSLPGANMRGNNHRLSLVVLAAVFSSMAAFNLAFFRHLRHVNAVSSRSRRKRA